MTKNDLYLALMCGIDIPIPELQVICHPPTVKEIALMGESQYFGAMQYLCINKELFSQGETVLQTMTNFQILMKVLKESDKDRKTSLTTLLSLLFPDYQVIIMPASINLLQDSQVIMIDDNNFDMFQEIIKEVLCVHNIFQGENIVYKPANNAAKRIANKIYKGRSKVAEIKAQEGGSSVLLRYLSVLRVGPKIPIPESINYNLFQLFDLMERYTNSVEWDTDLKIRLAGGKPDHQVESWMKELHSNK